ncbi:RICIN domain-containing protein [Actinomadura litoris]|uniref:RICIN domain-containing protein n=1 Tax=Actinomadura litoris TaxID=2678616 RepID=UPI001FA75331|nr:ricin-type beta-trefoil lectin domain protein [Actinomadura litoris]
MRLPLSYLAVSVAAVGMLALVPASHASARPSDRSTSSKVLTSPVIFRIQLQNSATNRCLQADASGHVSTNVICDNGFSELWDLNTTLGALRNEGTGACLDSNDAGEVYTGVCNNANYQSWRFAPANINSDYLWNVATGRFLDSNDQGAVYTSTFNGANFQAWFHAVLKS